MSDQPSAPEGGDAIAVITPAADTPASLSVSEAARVLNSMRNRPKEAAPVEAPAKAAPVEPNELDAQASDADPVEDPGEEPSEAEPAAEPPIERPRSWTKDEDAEWQSLPRAMQQKIVAREQERDTGLRRTQNEAAEQRKAFEAQREAAEKARQEYEAKLPGIMEILQSRGDFRDIRTIDDARKMQAEDPFRFQAWQVHQMELQAVNAELQQAETRKAQETQSKWTEHVQKENALASERIPELADPKQAVALQAKAADKLRDLGFSDQELTAYASGKDRLSIYDHRLQSLIFDAMKYAEIKAAPAKAMPKPVPPVTRPGTSRPPGAAMSEKAQALDKQLTQSGSLKAAQELRALQLSRRR